MPNMYRVEYRTPVKSAPVPMGSNHSHSSAANAGWDYFSLHILTDSIQSAIAIARSKSPTGAEITNVYLDTQDPIIDYSVIQPQGN